MRAEMQLEDPIGLVDLSNEPRRDSILTRMEETIRRGDFIQGVTVAEFETDFAAYCKTEFAVAVGSGTDAIHLAIRACGIGAGDEIVLPANTSTAAAEAVEAAGAVPVFADILPETSNLDPERLEQAVSARTRAVIPVHLYGQPADMENIKAVADRHGLIIIEDACQAHGAMYGGKRVGSIGDAGAFSFHPSKNLGAWGDGGIIVTGRRDVAEKARLLGNHGRIKGSTHVMSGFCSRLDSIQAAVLLEKLYVLDEMNEARRTNAALYDALIDDSLLVKPQIPFETDHVWHLYVIRTADRYELRKHLTDAGIETGVHYPVPLHLLPAFSRLGHKRGDFPVSERLAEEIVSLPMYPRLSRSHIERISGLINDFTNACWFKERSA